MAYSIEERRIKRNESSKKWKDKNKEHVKAYGAKNSKKYFAENKEKIKDKLLFKQYGIRLSHYLKLLEDQEFKCKICNLFFGNKQINVDHCHNTGKIRGLLCSSCNISLGHLKDDVKTIESLLNYLKTNS